ncbi:proteasome assembly chaperone 4 isoform X1 [Hemiscyllium ocellatum]|uniref:proteasome assembly chaperone 4 isoform X1 n=1 Tax=Hemiscyllium ocellatum TaxID=170820 RepID=UPI0029673B8A|nr:proteasome assembly chaperone 4 isoform X1 [Hemiscyllium ocellatum]
MQAAGEAGAATQRTLSVHNFSEKLSEQMVHFHVLRMKDSFFLWVGSTPTLSNLAVAMCTKFDPMPVSTLILGDSSDTTPNSVAQRLDEELLDLECALEGALRRRQENRFSSATICPAPTPASHCRWKTESKKK